MDPRWYVIHTYAGYENKVKSNLEHRIESMDMGEMIFRVVVPTEDVMEIKGGKKEVVQKKMLPGYILVQMELDDDSWYVVRNTPGVTGFVGSSAKPTPLTEGAVPPGGEAQAGVRRPPPTGPESSARPPRWRRTIPRRRSSRSP